MDLQTIKARVAAGHFKLSLHAEIEAEADSLEFAQIVEAISDGAILESYPDTSRGESCLIVGFSGETPIHAVCGMRGEDVIIVTVYVPQPPEFLDPFTRGEP